MFKQLLKENPRAFAFAFVIALVLMIMLVAALNFIVNPMAQYTTKFFEPIVQTSRAQKVQLESALKRRPQGLVLGSSRVMKLEPDYLEQVTGKSFFNAGVNYGKPEDFLAWLRLYQSKYDGWPEIVVIGIDPSSLSREMKSDPRLMTTRELARQISDRISIKDRISVRTELLAWDHTKRSIKSLRYQLLKKKLPEPVEHYREDGLLVYDQREEEIREGTYDFESPLQYNQREYLPRYHAFGGLSEQRKQMLKEIAAGCQTNDSQLVIYLTPLHPDLRAFLVARCDYGEWLKRVVTCMYEISEEYDFDFHDFSQVKSFDGDSELFIDGTHPLEPNTRKIIDRLFPSQLAPGS